jgi:hypothetical protein
MPEYCVICGDEIDENDGIDYIEEPTEKNINNAFYLSRDIRKQYKPICKYEFDKPDGYIFIFDKTFKESPIEFLFKEGIVSRNTTNNNNIFEHDVKKSATKDNENKLDFEDVNTVCKIAEYPHMSTISNKIQMAIIELPYGKGIEYLKETINKFGGKTYVFIRYNDDRFERIQIYVDKNKTYKFFNVLEKAGFFAMQ